jgi:hypothetical protein
MYIVIKTLSQYCRKLSVLIVPHITLNATRLKITMESLTELSALHIKCPPTREGAEITRIIGQSKTLVNLSLRSSGKHTVAEGLLKTIADGCPNLTTLKCGPFNCSNSEICYFMQRRTHQLVAYEHYGLVYADLIKAMNQCTNLKRLIFINSGIDGPLHEIPPITQLQNLTILEVEFSKYTVLEEVPLTLFINTLPNLSYIGIKYTQAETSMTP